MHMHHSNESDIPPTLVGISFEDSFRAQEFLVAVNGLAAGGRLKLKDAVTVVKDDVGKTIVHESIDPTPGRAALSGAMLAGLFGLILGAPVGWFKDTVQPRTATVALLVEDLDQNALVSAASRFSGAELVYANLDDATIARISDAVTHPAP
jgi:uncharacterized membrane protein